MSWNINISKGSGAHLNARQYRSWYKKIQQRKQLISDLEDLLSDSVKYPQLTLHEHHTDRIKRMLDKAKKDE